MTLRHLLMGTVVALAVPAMASAQGLPEGLYFGSQVGMTWLNDTTFEATPSSKADYKGSVASVVEGGYRFGNGLRLGAEIGYSRATIGDITGGSAGRSGGNGQTSALTYMGVAAYEIQTGTPFRPYIGGGVGVADIGLHKAGNLFTAGENASKSDTTVAWQLNAGVTYSLFDNMDVSLGYRYLNADPVKTTSSLGRDFKYEYESHSVMVGLRVLFGSTPAPKAAPAVLPVAAPAPAPAPVAAPAPAPTISRNFTVFFDWNKAVLSADAQQVLNNVISNAKTGKIAAIQVSGYTDTSGSPDYNLKLSQQRAEAVREYLVSKGVPAGEIAVQAKGETDLLVPTADNVREPSNRRAVIIFP